MSNIEKLFSFALIAWSAAAFGSTVVVPNGDTFGPGNTGSPYPKSPQSVEFQELLGGGNFHSNPITITGISFRAAPGSGPVDATIANLTVTLSTSPKFPNTNGGASLMSSTFASNVGADKTQVFSGSNVTVKDSGCPANIGPCPFDLNIVFQKPFVYSSSKGSLLIDMVETNLSATSGSLDTQSFTAPGGGLATVSGTAGSPTGTFAYAGPVVQVTYTTTAPAITGVVNVASNIPPGMPNYGIALGSLFAIYGSGMGSGKLSVSQVPLSTSALSGTSIQIMFTSPPALVTPLIYFARQDVVVAVMPSNAPPGNGTLILTYNGQTGNLPITTTQTGFGISNNAIVDADNGVGILNTAAVTFENYQPVTTTNTAKPGDILTVWGTGLGTSNNGDDANPPAAGNIGPAPQVFIGGVLSPSVSYWGRAPGSIPGLDQINFEVPPNAPLGCNVSIVVETINGATLVVSNAPTIALAATDGATCTDPSGFVTPSDLNLTSAKVLYLNTHDNVSFNPAPNGQTTSSTSSGAEVALFQQTQAQLAALAPTQNTEPSFGSCYVGLVSTSANGGGGLDATPLDAGPTITLTPPSGSPFNFGIENGAPAGIYSGSFGSVTLPSGSWTFSNGGGGPDVGPLTFKFPVPQPITWSNQSALAGGTINRASPLTITWTGGDANGYVDIQGSAVSGSALSGLYYIGFQCAAPVSAGQFTIPTSILLGMPAAFGNLQVGTISLPNILGAISGFDVAVSNSIFRTEIPVNFK